MAPHVAWRVCGGPSLTGWGGREVALDKYLLCCAACRAQWGPSFQLGMGNGPRKGPQNPAGHHHHRSAVFQPAPYFSVWVEVPRADPWGCRGCAAVAAAAWGMFWEGDPGVAGLGGAGDSRVSAHAGFGKVLELGVDMEQSRILGWTSHIHTLWESCSGGSAPQTPLSVRLPPGELKSWLCRLPRATLP